MKRKPKKRNNLKQSATYYRVYELLVEGKTRNQIAKTLKIDRVTLWRWTSSKEFKEITRSLFSEMKSLFIEAQGQALRKTIIMLNSRDDVNVKFAIGILLKAGSITIAEDIK